MSTQAEHLLAAQRRAAAVQAEIKRETEKGFADGNTSSVLPCLRIKLVETERLIAILADPELAAERYVAGYQRGRQDCARHLREELGLNQPGSSAVLALLRRLADTWEKPRVESADSHA